MQYFLLSSKRNIAHIRLVISPSTSVVVASRSVSVLTQNVLRQHGSSGGGEGDAGGGAGEGAGLRRAGRDDRGVRLVPKTHLCLALGARSCRRHPRPHVFFHRWISLEILIGNQ